MNKEQKGVLVVAAYIEMIAQYSEETILKALNQSGNDVDDLILAVKKFDREIESEECGGCYE